MKLATGYCACGEVGKYDMYPQGDTTREPQRMCSTCATAAFEAGTHESDCNETIDTLPTSPVQPVPCVFCPDRVGGRPAGQRQAFVTTQRTKYHDMPCCRTCAQWFDVEINREEQGS